MWWLGIAFAFLCDLNEIRYVTVKYTFNLNCARTRSLRLVFQTHRYLKYLCQVPTLSILWGQGALGFCDPSSPDATCSRKQQHNEHRSLPSNLCHHWTMYFPKWSKIVWKGKLKLGWSWSVCISRSNSFTNLMWIVQLLIWVDRNGCSLVGQSTGVSSL